MPRSTLKTKAPLRRSAKRKGGWFKKCDKLWGQLIRLRDGEKCQACGRDGRLNAHHLIHKAAMFYRHNLENGILLCFQCHTASGILSAHGAPWNFEKWMRFHRRKQYDWWQKNRNELHIGAKIDYRQVHEALEMERERLRGERKEADSADPTHP